MHGSAWQARLALYHPPSPAPRPPRNARQHFHPAVSKPSMVCRLSVSPAIRLLLGWLCALMSVTSANHLYMAVGFCAAAGFCATLAIQVPPACSSCSQHARSQSRSALVGRW
eukprot:1677122-Rhodomonas_salina.3